MITKALEIRDRGTFIPMFAIQMTPSNLEQKYLLRRAGYGSDQTLIMLGYMGESGMVCCYDYYDWNDRTRQTAHQHIQNNFNELKDGDVIDVEFILGETDKCKISDRL